MTARETPVTRRAFLAAAGALAAGCTSHRHAPAVDPDESAVASARINELALLAGSAPGSAAYDAHLAHLHALGGVAPAPLATPTPGRSPALAGATRQAERASVPVLQAAAASAHRGATAAVLASIAAAHAVLGGAQPAR